MTRSIQRLGAGMERVMTVVLGRIGLAFTASTLAAALLVMAAQIVSRYVIGSSLVWAEEVARYCLIWSSMVGAAVAYHQARHVGITYFVEHLPPRLEALVSRTLHLLALGLFVLMAWEGWHLTLRNFARTQLSPALQIPIAWIYLAVPVGGVLLGLSALAGVLHGRPPTIYAVTEIE